MTTDRFKTVHGLLTVYKLIRGHIITLLVPVHALRSNGTSRKCRVSEAVVSWMPPGITRLASGYDDGFIYRLGETVSVPNFDTNRWNECAPGIHVFANRQDAEAYRNHTI